MNEMRRFLEQLEALSWNEPNVAIRTTATLLSAVSLDHVRDLLSDWSDEALDQCAWESHETSTHFKWRLHRGTRDSFQVWLHEYKSQSLLRAGYADSVHDHRYWFASKILVGGFKQTTYRVSERDEGSFDAEEVERTSLDAGRVYIVAPDAVHSIADFEHPTLTLLVRSKATKPFSTEIRRREGRAVHYYPLRTRIRAFLESPRQDQR